MKKELDNVEDVLNEIKGNVVVTKIITKSGEEKYKVESMDRGFQVVYGKSFSLPKDKLKNLIARLKLNKSLYGYFMVSDFGLMRFILTFESKYFTSFDKAVEFAINNGLRSIYEWKRERLIKI